MGSVIDMSTRKRMSKNDIGENNVIQIKHMQDRNFVMIDCETGGLDPFRHSILSVGMIALVYDEESDCLIVKDELEIEISSPVYVVTEVAMAINGLDLNELQEHGVSPAYAVEAIKQFMERNSNSNSKTKPIVVGHNVGLDKYFIWKMMEECGVNFDSIFNHRMIDIMSLLWGLYYTGIIPLEACSSKGAYEYFNIENENPHNCLSDCIAQSELFDVLINELGGWNVF